MGASFFLLASFVVSTKCLRKGAGFVAVLLLILLISIAGVWWVKPQLLQNIPVISGILPSRLDLSDPKIYVPKENIKYTIHEVYPDSVNK